MKRKPITQFSLAVNLTATLLLAASPAALHAQTVSFAGAQHTVGSGLNQPVGVAVDRGGDVFIADYNNNRVVKVPAGGGAQTTVGSGLLGPIGVAVDGAGDVFIADTENSRVVEVPAGGGAQTTVGTGLILPDGVAVDGAGDVFIADSENSRVVEVPAGSGTQTTVYSSGRNGPIYVAVDGAGNVFIADGNNNLVVEVPVGGGAQTTVGSSGLKGPNGVAVDGAGNVFIADGNNNLVVEVPVGGGAQTTVGSSGLKGPNGVAVDGAGNVFIADNGNNRVVEVPAGGGAQTTVGSGLSLPIGVAVDGAGDVFIADSNNNRVLEVQAVSVNFGSAKIGSSAALMLNYNITADGTLGTPNVLTQGAPNLDFTLASGSTCTGDVTAGSSCTVNVTFAPRAPGPRMGAVEIVDASGTVLATTMIHGQGVGPAVAFGPGVQATVGSGLYNPEGVAVDAAGDVFIADSYNNRVVEVPAGGGGTQITVGSGLTGPRSVTVDGAGDVFIADLGNSPVVKVPAGGGAQTTVGNGLSDPYGVAVDAAGDVFIADTDNSRVVEVPAGGGVQTIVGSGLNRPFGVAVDGAGNVCIADNFNNRVVEVQRPSPPALSFAATPVNSTSSDSPQSVTVDNIGNATLSLSGLAVGANFAQVAGSGTPADCTSSSSLAPGETCNLSISFTPTTSGSIAGAAKLSDNSLNGNPATQTISLSGTGNLLTQTITFGAIANQVVGNSLTLSASASSGLTVSFASLTTPVCTVSGTTATLVGTGTCTIQASQPGSAVYAAATPVSQSFSVTDFSLAVTPSSQTISSGHSASYSVALKSLNGFTGTVALGCSGGPLHSTCTVSPVSVTLSSSATANVTVTLQTAQNVNHGTFPLTITAKAGTDTHTATVSLTVK
jgi:sugar lactone lactonase YvrE